MLKRNSNVYLSSGSYLYKLPVYADLSFSQVYSEEQLAKKTLHNPENLIPSGFTSTLNPGNFNFTIPIIDTEIARALSEIFVSEIPQSHPIYVENEGLIIRLNNCVIQNIVFNFARDAINTLSISGSYSHSETIIELPAVTPSLPGTIYTYVEALEIDINGSTVDTVTSINIEISNSVNWLQNQTMHDSGPVYRKNFVFTERTVSATVVANEQMSNPIYDDNADISITVSATNTDFLVFNLPSCILTTRNQLDEVVKKGYDIRAKEYSILYKGVQIT